MFCPILVYKMSQQFQQPAPGSPLGLVTPLTQPSGAQTAVFNLENVSLLTQTDTGVVELPGLSLELGPPGITIKRSNGALVKTVPWDVITAISVEDEPKVVPSDPDCSLVYVQTKDRTHRFKKRNQEAKSIAESIGDVASQYTSAKGATVSRGMEFEQALPWVIFAAMVIITVVLVVLHLSNIIKIA